MKDSSKPGTSRWPVLVALAAIGVATLPPDQQEIAGSAFCLVCGGRGLADLLLNVMLFAPFGSALAGLRAPAWRVVAIGFGVSGGIELLQFAIPGRDPSLSDLVANSIGAWAGFRLFHAAPSWFVWSARRPWRALGATLGLVFGALLFAAWLIQPGFPRTDYYGQWTPEFGNMEQYQGQVRKVELGDINVPSTLVRESGRARAALLAGVPLRIHAAAGPPPTSPAPIFNIYDEHQREIISVVADGDDLILRSRTRAAALRLDQPAYRVNDLLRGVRAGEALAIELRILPRGFCLSLNGRPACPLGLNVGGLWAVLITPEAIPGAVERVAGLMFLFALFVLVGFTATGPRSTLVALGVTGLALLAIPHFLGLLATPIPELLSGLIGVLAGRVLRVAIQVRWGATQATGLRAAARASADTSTARHRSMRA